VRACHSRYFLSLGHIVPALSNHAGDPQGRPNAREVPSNSVHRASSVVEPEGEHVVSSWKQVSTNAAGIAASVVETSVDAPQSFLGSKMPGGGVGCPRLNSGLGSAPFASRVPIASFPCRCIQLTILAIPLLLRDVVVHVVNLRVRTLILSSDSYGPMVELFRIVASERCWLQHYTTFVSGLLRGLQP
jgi:hypothetical protein